MESTTKSTFAVLRFTDLFGTGYLVHSQADVAAAIADGWEVIADGLTRADADNICRIYKYAGQPESNVASVLSDLLVYDFTETVETRAKQTVQEFDLVRLALDLDGNGKIWREHTVTYFDTETVELDGCIEVSRGYALANMKLIAKAEDNDFVIEYGQFLTEESEKWNALYTIAVEASLGMAA